MKIFQNILIVRTDRIGDVILTTPAVAALREAYPLARLSMAVTPTTREVVEGNPHVDEVIVYEQNGRHRGFLGYWQFIRELRKRKFDAAVIYHTKKRTNLICFLAGIPHRIGFQNNKWGFLLTQKVKDTRPLGDKHEYQYCLEVLKRFGVDTQVSRPVLYLPFKKEAEDWAERFWLENGLRDSKKTIAIHAGASCISKRWPAARFADVINHLLAKYPLHILLIGGSDSRHISGAIKSQVKSPLLDLTGQTSLSQLASLLKRCQLLISNDSGPVHVAVAVGTPVISIFGRNQAGLSPTRWRPLGPFDIVLHKEVGCEVCLAHNCQIDFECLRAIGPDDVLEAVDALGQL